MVRYDPTHERDSERRILTIQKILDHQFKKMDNDMDTDIKNLADILDIQLKLEDYRVKFHEADHPNLKIWSPIILPAAVTLLAAILVAYLKVRN